jgi:hypothetical protein
MVVESIHTQITLISIIPYAVDFIAVSNWTTWQQMIEYLMKNELERI